MSRNTQVARDGQRPASSPELDREIARRLKLRTGPPTEADRPPVSTLPGTKPHVHESQLSL